MPTAIFRDEVRRLVQEEGTQLVDVLPHEEYEEDHLPRAINIPLEELDRKTIARLDRDAPGNRLLPRLPFDLFGAFDAGPVAIAYAARHPERVSHLILWCSWARSSDIRAPRIRAWLGLIDQDWELMTDTCAHLALGWPAGEVRRHAAQRLRESVTPAEAFQHPTLGGVGLHVMHRRL